MSWLGGAFKDLTDKVATVKDQVQNALPADKKEMLEKLTLASPELVAERQRIDEEERRKEYIKDCLAGMLPWETRDPERDILVEECKEAMLKLSTNENTFKGPYQMPSMAVKLEGDNEKEGAETDEDEDGEEESDKNVEGQPSKESLEKLAKLEPLPKLLADFDLDAHVGLIQRLLVEDPNLVDMQSNLSGGGQREWIFWRNYFFHCAYTRYECGLSVDEVWSDQQPTGPTQEQAEPEIQHAHGGEDVGDEEVITFDHGGEGTEPNVSEAEFPSVADADKETSEPITTTSATDDALDSGVGASSLANSVTADYEIVTPDSGDDAFGGELDELEAEIARELED